MTPDQLDSLTLPEINAKLKGFKEFHGIREQTPPMSSKAMKRLMEAFPDGPLPQSVRRRIKRGKKKAAAGKE